MCLETGEVCWKEWRGEREEREGRERRHDGPHDSPGEAKEDSTDEDSVNEGSGEQGGYGDFITGSLAYRDPAGLWNGTGAEFPDPHTNFSGFLSYCGWSEKELTASVYVLPHQQIATGFTPPLISHGPTIYCEDNTVQPQNNGHMNTGPLSPLLSEVLCHCV